MLVTQANERDENMTYADIDLFVKRALAGGYGLRVELDAGVFDLFGDDLREEWDVLAPGEAFDVLRVVTRSASLHERASKMYEAADTARTFANVFSQEELEISRDDYCMMDAPDYYAAPYDDEVFDALALKGSN